MQDPPDHPDRPEHPPLATQAPPRLDVATTEEVFSLLQSRGWSGTLKRETNTSRQEFEIGRFEPVKGNSE